MAEPWVHRDTYLLWVAVTTVGLTWAGWFGHFPFGFPPGSGSAEATLSSAVVGAVIGALGGAAVAVAQWLVLRRLAGVSAWWIAATIAGIAAMHAVGDPLGDSGQVALVSPGFALVAGFGGLAISALQFPFIRAHLARAEWWIPLSAAGWTLGVIAGLGLVAVIGVRQRLLHF